MAGTASGAFAHTSEFRSTAAASIDATASTRTRRSHGAFLVGDELATVYSSRRQGIARGVILSVGRGAVTLTGSMSAAQARAMARSLIAAAAAIEPQGGAQ